MRERIKSLREIRMRRVSERRENALFLSMKYVFYILGAYSNATAVRGHRAGGESVRFRLPAYDDAFRG